MLILGLDISSVSTGWSILENDTLLDSGLIKIASNLSHPDKLSQFAHDLKCITRDHDIDWVVIEDQYFQNVVTVKILSRFCGVAIQVMNDILYSP
jgi:Holliday junction resolvasome RuvABC endonuclease subunit